MTTAKIQITVGSVSFSGEGTEAWLEKQLDKLLKSASSLAAVAPATETGGGSGSAEKVSGATVALGTYLTSKVATTNQVKKFLATANWLHLRGAKRLSTNDVTKALSEANQKRLTNASDALGQNVTKGFAQREGKQFYVTEEGLTSLK